MANPHRPTLPLLPHGSAHDQTKPARVKVVRYVSVARIARLIFVIAAPVQMAIVVLLQALIYHYGGVGEALPQYKHCLSDTLQMAINCSEKANWSNVTIPSFGKDTQVYVGFIISLTVYNVMLCFYALFKKSFCEMIAFLIVNILTMVYAAVEVFEFRPFGPKCEIPVACRLAIGSVVVLFIFTILFVLLMVCIRQDFNRKVDRVVNHNELLTKYYLWYEVISSGIKLVILLTIVFCVAWIALLLYPGNFEFALTIILVVVAFMTYFIVQLTIRYNSFTGYLAIAFTGVLLLVYYAFKIWRFSTKNCPVCEDATSALQKERDALEWLLKICVNTTTATLPVDTDRSIKFESLYIFASVNMVITFVVFAIYLCFCCFQPGKVLRDHFENNTNRSWIVRIVCCHLGNHSFIKNVKDVEIKDIKDWCVQFKKEWQY